jgi:hypothetical protein
VAASKRLVGLAPTDDAIGTGEPDNAFQHLFAHVHVVEATVGQAMHMFAHHDEGEAERAIRAGLEIIAVLSKLDVRPMSAILPCGSNVGSSTRTSRRSS